MEEYSIYFAALKSNPKSLSVGVWISWKVEASPLFNYQLLSIIRYQATKNLFYFIFFILSLSEQIGDDCCWLLIFLATINQLL